MPRRRTLIIATSSLFLPRILRAQPLRELRIGFQKSGPLLVAKHNRSFEERFAAQGVEVKWVEFTFGPPMMEAMNVGSIDFGTVGNTPPVFAQAARARVLYVAVQRGNGASQAILLPEGSTLDRVADLKGRRLAYARGSSAHDLAVVAVEGAGIAWSDIQRVELPPADAGAAFARGNVDAWSIWDPFYALTEVQRGVRVLLRGEAMGPQNSFFLANRGFAEAHPRVLGEIVAELGRIGAWCDGNRAEVARMQSAETGVQLDAMQRGVQRASFDIVPMNEVVIAHQQRVADRFQRLGLIPRAIVVREIVWQPPAS
jgi:aliphatic sulfonates family ABC transporter substrate-binding protein